MIDNVTWVCSLKAVDSSQVVRFGAKLAFGRVAGKRKSNNSCGCTFHLSGIFMAGRCEKI